MFWFAAAVVATACTLPASAQIPCRYTVIVLPNHFCGPTGSPGNPVAINNLGHVLLTVTQCGTGNSDTYVWTGGPSLTLIPRPPGMFHFQGRDLNDHGLIVGEAWYTTGGLRAVIYNTNNGQWTVLPPLNPPDGWSSAAAINNNNEVCGYRSIGSAKDPGWPRTAFVWSADGDGTWPVGFSDLGLIEGMGNGAVDIANDGSVAVARGLGFGAYKWRVGKLDYLGFLRGSDSTGPAAIVDGGRVVGGALIIQGSMFWGVPLDFATGSPVPLPYPDTTNTNCQAIDLNSEGLIVGQCAPPIPINPPWRAFMWHHSRAIAINDLLDPSAQTILRRPRGINEKGMILCEATTASQPTAVVVTPQRSVTGDTNCDQSVDIDDLLNVIVAWGLRNSSVDLNNDGIVDIADLLIVLMNWGQN